MGDYACGMVLATPWGLGARLLSLRADVRKPDRHANHKDTISPAAGVLRITY